MPRLYDTNGQSTGCRGPRWYLRFVDQLQAQLDTSEPERDFYCRYCRTYHIIKADRLVSVETETQPRRYYRRPPVLVKPVKPNYCPAHRTASTRLTSLCAYCSGQLHIHLGALGQARRAVVTETCPNCHRTNAIRGRQALATWKLKGQAEVPGVVVAMRLDRGALAVQTELLKW
jgi:hypothetical protein